MREEDHPTDGAGCGAHEERQDKGEDHRGFGPALRARQAIGDRRAEEQAEESRAGGNLDRQAEDAEIEGIADEGSVVCPGDRGNDHLGGVEAVEAIAEEQDKRGHECHENEHACRPEQDARRQLPPPGRGGSGNRERVIHRRIEFSRARWWSSTRC